MKKTQKSYNSTLRKTSKKQAKHEQEWSKIKKERIEQLKDRYGYLICEYCKRAITSTQIADGHHIDGDHQNNSKLNCAIVHEWPCHRKITDETIIITQIDDQGDFREHYDWGQ